MIIAFSGNDGSGKTTIIKSIIQIFENLGFKVKYRHEYDYLILKYLFKILGERKVEEERRKMLIDQKKSIIYYLWPFLVWFDLIVSYLYYKIFKRKEIIILDRYPYDHYLSFVKLGYITSFTQFLYEHFPKADINIILWVEPEIAFERKKKTHDYPLEFYEIQTQRYLKLAEKLKIPSINTNKSIKITIEEILDIFCDNKKFKRQIIKRGMQNKTFFEIFSNYRNTKIYKNFEKIFEKRKEKYIKSIILMKEIFEKTTTNEYVVFKDYNDYNWIGNDIDVLLPKEKLDKLERYLKKTPLRYKINRAHNPPSIDIVFDNDFILDIHQKIGWRNTEIIDFEELKGFITLKNKFGVTYYSIYSEVDAFIYSLSHLFEKGFVPKLEYNFIIENYDKLVNISKKFLDINSQEIYHQYLSFLKSKKYDEFPLFIPLSILIRILWKITVAKNLSLLVKIKTIFTILSMQLFWRIRYRLKGILPFEIDDFH